MSGTFCAWLCSAHDAKKRLTPDRVSVVLRSGVSLREYWDLSYSVFFLPFFRDLVPNTSYSGFHSCYLKHCCCSGLTWMTVHIRECCAMDMIGTIGIGLTAELTCTLVSPFLWLKNSKNRGENQVAEWIKIQGENCMRGWLSKKCKRMLEFNHAL